MGFALNPKVRASGRANDDARSNGGVDCFGGERGDSMRKLKWLAASLIAVAGSVAGGEGLREPDARQQTLTLHLRTYYLDREKPTPPDFKSHAAGGWIGYDSGWFYD